MYMCAEYHRHVGRELSHHRSVHYAVACAEGRPRMQPGFGAGAELPVHLVAFVRIRARGQVLARLVGTGQRGATRLLA